MKTKITYSTIKYLLGWTANQIYPPKANLVFIRNKDMSVIKIPNYKSKEQYRKELKQYLYTMFKQYNLTGGNYDLEQIEHWNTKGENKWMKKT